MKLLNKIITFIIFVPVILKAEVPWNTVSFSILDNTQSATFHMDKFFFGIDVQNVSTDAHYTQNVWTYFPPVQLPSGGQTEAYYADISDHKTMSLTAWLLTPRFGKRFNLKTNNKIQSYTDIACYMSIPFFELNANNTNDEDDDNESDEQVEEVENAVGRLLDFIGFKFSYGVLYKINDQLSFSTAVGYNHAFSDFHTSLDSNDNLVSGRRIDIDSNSGTTFTTFSINYSF